MTRRLALAMCALLVFAGCSSGDSGDSGDEAQATTTDDSAGTPGGQGDEPATTGTAPADNPATMGYDLDALSAAVDEQTEFCDAYRFTNDTGMALLKGATATADQAEVAITFLSLTNAKLIEVAPAELVDPLQVVADAYSDVTELAAQANFDPAVVFEPGFGEELATDAVMNAQADVDTYFLSNCTQPGDSGE